MPADPADYLDEPCEDCGAPAGRFCRPDCGTGLTFDEWHGDRDATTQPDEPVPPGW